MSDISITAASVVPTSNAQVQTVVAGAAITAGQLIYIDSNGKAQLSDANASTTTQSVAGIAVCNAAAGQYVTYAISDTALAIGGTLTAGEPLYLSETAGGITQTFADLSTGAAVIIFGIAASTTTAKIFAAQTGPTL